jgi:hypothetical protein
MSRRDGTRVARWVTDRVREVAPPGLGRWPRAWELVEAPSAEFLDALAAWEETGAPEDKAAASQAASVPFPKCLAHARFCRGSPARTLSK